MATTRTQKTKKVTKAKPKPAPKPKATATKVKVGRPTKFTEQLAEEFCRRIAEGRSERQVCQDEDMPTRITIRNWKLENPTFLAKCARAREERADVLLDEMEDIENDVKSGKISPSAGNVILSSKQWRASKMNPKQYGNKVDLTSSDGSMTPARTPKEVALELIKQVDELSDA